MKRILGFLIVMLLTSCSSSVSPAAEAVEVYWQALVKEPKLAINLSCTAWEDQAQLDADTFDINPATSEGLVCTEAGQENGFTLVVCTGKLMLDYNGEIQEIDLSTRTYKAIEEGGEWRMCGYR